jgi:hypothetical protein
MNYAQDHAPAYESQLRRILTNPLMQGETAALAATGENNQFFPDSDALIG